MFHGLILYIQSGLKKGWSGLVGRYKMGVAKVSGKFGVRPETEREVNLVLELLSSELFLFHTLHRRLPSFYISQILFKLTCTLLFLSLQDLYYLSLTIRLSKELSVADIQLKPNTHPRTYMRLLNFTINSLIFTPLSLIYTHTHTHTLNHILSE